MTDVGQTGRLMTGEELYHLPEIDKRYELVNGELRISELSGFFHGAVAARLASELWHYVRARGLGEALGRVGYVLRRDPDTVRAPDVSFIQRERLPAPERAYWFYDGPADLSAEIVEPDDDPAETAEKVADALAAGVRTVWVVDPTARTAVVHTPNAAAQPIAQDGALDGRDVIPGFRLSLADLFDVLHA